MKTTLTAALDARGYDTLTAVQQAVTDPDTLGRDMLVSAQTGSGKTLGFGLAIAPTIIGEGDHFEDATTPVALVIAPTRELAMQVKRELSWLFELAGARIASTVGGNDMRDERRALARGAHIVVATPGRLRDHIMRESIDLSQLKAVVLDEADEMLDLGFREDLEFILDAAPEDRQTLLFSATVPPAIGKMAQRYQRDALRIATANATKQHADIEYRAFNVSPRDGENAIINVLRYYEAPNSIVFCNTRAMVNRLTTRLSNRGFSVVALSGELSQSERTHALQAMRDGRARVCVATDVAARGIDLPNLDLVVHAELPSNQETLLHRSGRTGRAGRKGVSALIVPPASRKKAERILKWAKLTAEWDTAPSAEAVSAKDEERMLANASWQDDIAAADQSTIERLMQAFTPEQIAAAYLRMYREKHTAPEELSEIQERPQKDRAPFGPSVWFSIDGGRKAGAEPRRILPVVCKAGNLSKDDIGAIRIQQDASFVEIRESSVAGFLKSVGPDMVLEDTMVISQLPGAPVFDRGPKPPRKDGFDRKKKPAFDRPKYDNADRRDDAKEPFQKADKPRKPSLKSTPPVDWNDAPDSKPKKPKGAKKPATAAKGKPAPNHPPEAVIERPRKPRANDPSKRADAPGKGKGAKPPAGKPNSKKNKARKAGGGKSAGFGPPTRKSGKPKSKS